MGLWTDVVGTVRGYIRLGLTGVRLKNSSGTLAVRNAGDSAYANVECGDVYLGPGNKLVFEGTTDDAYETTVDPGDPTADRTLTLPDTSGTIVAENAWTDYSATSTIVGWSSYTTKLIYYKDIGKTRFMYVHIDGTSNSTSTSFTLPSACTNTMSFGGQIRTDDNGNTNLGHYVLLANTSTVNCYYGVSAAAWTASGTKRLLGQFTYQLP